MKIVSEKVLGQLENDIHATILGIIEAVKNGKTPEKNMKNVKEKWIPIVSNDMLRSKDSVAMKKRCTTRAKNIVEEYINSYIDYYQNKK
jgi:hypothetical protein